MADLEALGFHLVGYGCTTCIGNSGPLPDADRDAIEDGNLVVAAVLSGNRNFEGRVNPDVRANYLASPPLVVAYALAGTMDIDLETRAARHRHGRQAGVPARHLADAAGGRRRDAQARSSASSSRSATPHVFEGDADWQRARRSRRATRSRGTTSRRTSASRRSSTTSARRRSRSRDIDGRARARDARRLDHDRPHLAGRQHRQGRARPRSTSTRTASSPPTSTRTARAAATTR